MTRDRVVCGTCGMPRPDDEVALLAWSRNTAGARTDWTCPRCAREHLRAIEAKLDHEWW